MPNVCRQGMKCGLFIEDSGTSNEQDIYKNLRKEKHCVKNSAAIKSCSNQVDMSVPVITKDM